MSTERVTFALQLQHKNSKCLSLFLLTGPGQEPHDCTPLRFVGNRGVLFDYDINKPSVPPGTIMTFSLECDLGYYADGVGEYTCHPDGGWSPEFAVCRCKAVLIYLFPYWS